MVRLECSIEEMEYNILEEGSKGFLGLGSKPAIIEAKKKETEEERLMAAATDFLTSVFETLKIDVKLEVSFNDEERTIEINMIGEDMGNLIGKRGQTLDSLQYLTSLVVNKNHEEYIRVKLDTENYRERRKETLESLAKNIAFKVKRTKRPVKLEPMNPYERRIIHSTLQGDKYVYTKSEGEEPYRHVVVMLKRERRYQDNRQNA
jgi:spoIIIJ-associated protein